MKNKLIKYDGLDTGGVSSKHYFRAYCMSAKIAIK